MRATASHAGLERQLRLAGEGAFAVDEFAVSDLATALGMSEAAGRAYVGQSLKLRDRLPKCWARVMDGTLPAWKGRRIAEQTIPLKPEVAAAVDANLAPFASHMTIMRMTRAVEAAILRHDPELAEERDAAAADKRGAWLEDHLVHLHLDAVQARGVEGPATSTPAQAMLARVDRSGRRLGARTQATVERWLAGLVPGAAVTVTPVIDLTEDVAVDSYEASPRLRRQVTERDATCCFPWCGNAGRHDLDHVIPYVPPNEGGPPGQTSTRNLARLCRFHHRLKTHGAWVVERSPTSSALVWSSPLGRRYVVDRKGTHPLT